MSVPHQDPVHAVHSPDENEGELAMVARRSERSNTLTSRAAPVELLRACWSYNDHELRSLAPVDEEFEVIAQSLEEWL